MTAAKYDLYGISRVQIKVISSRIYLVGWNESKLNQCKSAQMSLNKPKEPEWA